MTMTPEIDVPPESPGILRSVAIGSAIGVVVALLTVGGALLLAGEGMSAALAIGGMGAIWGGLGFGSMFGGVTYMTRHEED